MNTYKKLLTFLLVGVLCFTFLYTPTSYSASHSDLHQIIELTDSGYVQKGFYFSGSDTLASISCGKDTTLNTSYNHMRIWVGLPFKLPPGTRMDVNVSLKYGNGTLGSGTRLWFGKHRGDGAAQTVHSNTINMTSEGYPILLNDTDIITTSTTNSLCVDFYLNRTSTSIYINIASITITLKTDVGEIRIPNANTDSLDDLVGDMDMDKFDPDNFNSDLSYIVSDESITNYSAVLATVTESPTVFPMLIIVFTVGLVGYALFGKKGG